MVIFFFVRNRKIDDNPNAGILDIQVIALNWRNTSISQISALNLLRIFEILFLIVFVVVCCGFILFVLFVSFCLNNLHSFFLITAQCQCSTLFKKWKQFFFLFLFFIIQKRSTVEFNSISRMASRMVFSFPISWNFVSIMHLSKSNFKWNENSTKMILNGI